VITHNLGEGLPHAPTLCCICGSARACLHSLRDVQHVCYVGGAVQQLKGVQYAASDRGKGGIAARSSGDAGV
jgi:hypothetical protein